MDLAFLEAQSLHFITSTRLSSFVSQLFSHLSSYEAALKKNRSLSYPSPSLFPDVVGSEPPSALLAVGEDPVLLSSTSGQQDPPLSSPLAEDAEVLVRVKGRRRSSVLLTDALHLLQSVASGGGAPGGE